ncbi:hypothetical protein [Vagococcus sp. CY53-2]|uniref:hypothetical protein n=1 Tax=Vagococcus sp. CY53-2 TaxID=2925780 RepID=UPI001F511236|nr:hypothetical protein [Vagococcus sp. CY53-2]MCI0130045.1 hypothetical protein [Vagococcus sp. CY53-2]
MAKTIKKVSDTQQLREALPSILKTIFKEGATFDELWEELSKNKKLAKIMYTDDKKPRIGLLQGLSNRVKDGKEENMMMVKKEDGKNYFVYYDSSLDKQIKLTTHYISSIKSIEFDKDTKFTEEKETLLKQQTNLIKKLEELNVQLVSKK